VPRRSLSLARMAVFMSSVIWSLSDIAGSPYEVRDVMNTLCLCQNTCVLT
jgi:hypothetical protein